MLLFVLPSSSNCFIMFMFYPISTYYFVTDRNISLINRQIGLFSAWKNVGVFEV